MNNNEIEFAKKRMFFDKLLELLGKFAILISALFLISLLSALVINTSGVFTSYYIKVNLPAKITVEKTKAEDLLEEQIYPNKNFLRFFSVSAIDQITNNKLTGETLLLASAKLKEFLSQHKELDDYSLSEKELIKTWKEQGSIKKKLDLGFFFNKESREAELAGIYTSLIGTIYTILICIIISIPIAICTAIYLEEFAKKNLLTTLIEINLSNLASIPSIVYGLLALSVLINFLGLPRSAPITAGITLAMMILPTLVITARQAIKSVPTNIKHAALALGATKTQVIFHHTLPLSLPGIATGIILSLARAIGETAPLILIGMVAFIVEAPKTIFEPTTVLPVQIYLWSSSPEQGFQEKTSAAIIFLLLLLIAFNAFAVYVRKKYEKKW